MDTRKKIVAMAFVCLSTLTLATAMGVVLKKYVERPFRIHGDVVVLIDWANPQTDAEGRAFVPWTMTGSQMCTEGWFKNTGSGVLYLDTLVAEGSGECCECNGGAIAWESTEQFSSHHGTVTFISGTGPFSGVRNQYEYDYTPLITEEDEDGNPVKLIYSFWGEGKLGLMQ